jgi:hypothetical protein
MSGPLPVGWHVPKWDAKAPMPCTKAMLLAWLAEHHNLGILPSAPMDTVVAVIERHYFPKKIPNTGGGDVPATWDCWAFVAKEEKRIRGGQRSLFAVEGG